MLYLDSVNKACVAHSLIVDLTCAVQSRRRKDDFPAHRGHAKRSEVSIYSEAGAEGNEQCENRLKQKLRCQYSQPTF